MVEQITKEMLIERLKSLDDNTILTQDILEKLIVPDGSPEVLRQLDMMHRDDPEDLDYLIKGFAKTRNDITEVHKPHIGILPNDLKHPIQVAGMGWSVRLREMGGFETQCDAYAFNAVDEEELFTRLNHCIERHKWIHTYIYTIAFIPGYTTFNSGKSLFRVRMCGITQENLDQMKEKGDMKDSITWVDRAQAIGMRIQMPEVED